MTLGRILASGKVTDNSRHQIKDKFFYPRYQEEKIGIQKGQGAGSSRRAWGFLSDTSKAIQQLVPSEEDSSLVLFNDEEYEHNTSNSLIQLSDGHDCKDFSLTTGNLIGCVTGSYEGYPYTLRISSRFGDEFLKFIIADADGFLEIPDYGGIDQGNFDWLLSYLWLIKLRKAYRLGLPKAYESRTERLVSVKGRLDPVDYALNHMKASYRCTYREHSYNNSTTRLIARTLQHLDTASPIKAPHKLKQTFQIASEGERRSLQELLATAPVRNPYYADYIPVVSLAKRILKNEFADFGQNLATNALLFDVSMLFEYFVRKLLQKKGVSFHPKDKKRWTTPSGIVAGSYSKRKLIPDLVFDIEDRTFVFDVKYKSFDFRYGVNREDLFQIHTYLGQISNEYPVAGCGFIYPIKESLWKTQRLDECQGIYTDIIKQTGNDVPFHIVFLKVPSEDCPSIFRSSFKEGLELFTNNFLKRLSPQTH